MAAEIQDGMVKETIIYSRDSQPKSKHCERNYHTWTATCAVERRFLLAGANPAQQLSLRLVAARAVYGGNDVD